MDTNQFYLLLTTLLAQFSIGLVVLFNTMIYWPAFNNRGRIRRMIKTIPTAGFVMAVLSCLFSWIANLGVLNFLGIYTLTLMLFLVFTWGNTDWHRVQKMLLDLVSLAGLFYLFRLGQSDQMVHFGAWHKILTPITIYLYSFLTGSFMLLFLISSTGSYSSQISLTTTAAGLCFLLIAIVPISLAIFNADLEIGQQLTHAFLAENSWPFFTRIVLLLGSIVLCFRILFILRSESVRFGRLFLPISLGMLAVIVSACLEQILYFSTA